MPQNDINTNSIPHARTFCHLQGRIYQSSSQNYDFLSAKTSRHSCQVT